LENSRENADTTLQLTKYIFFPIVISKIWKNLKKRMDVMLCASAAGLASHRYRQRLAGSSNPQKGRVEEGHGFSCNVGFMGNLEGKKRAGLPKPSNNLDHACLQIQQDNLLPHMGK
jgi:hypothetical protein